MNIIGISGLHNSVPFKRREWPNLSKREYRIAQGFDSAAALVNSSGIVAAAAEERFTRNKATGSFPFNAIHDCLQAGGIGLDDVDLIAHGFSYAPVKSLFGDDDYARRQYGEIYAPEVQIACLRQFLPAVDWEEKFVPVPHHLAHAASAFYLSGFDESLILVSDGMGEVDSATIALGKGSDMEIIRRVSASHSLGVLYGVFTLYLGFYFAMDEFKVMGLAPYGDRRRFFGDIMQLVNLKGDGTYTIPALAQKNVTTEDKETHRGILNFLVDRFGPMRQPGGEMTQDHKDIAAGIQAVLQACQLHVLRHFKRETGARNLCMAGGVALNCSVNGAIRRSRMFQDVFVQPAAGDDGTALGAALYAQRLNDPNYKKQKMSIPLWGSEYSDAQILKSLKDRETVETVAYVSFEDLCRDIALRLDDGQIVAWFQGRMEFGPRALGSRSILADPRDPRMRDRINSLVKKRESFRPFAPAVTEEGASEYFDIPRGDEDAHAHMLHVVQVRPTHWDVLPAVTHVDHSARVQTVSKQHNHRFWTLLHEFEKVSGIPILLNTSFNVKGQPIVCTPQEAVDTFLFAGLDILVLGNVVVLPRTGENLDRDRHELKEKIVATLV